MSGRKAPLLRRPGVWMVLVVVMILAGAILYQGRSDTIDRVWYFDLNTQTLFPGPYAAAPPIAAPSGAYDGPDADDCDHEAGALAMVVGPRAGGEPQVMYLQRFTRETRLLRQRQLTGEMLGQADESRVLGGLRVASPPAKPGDVVIWHTPGSPAGKAIMDRYDRIMGAGQVVLRLPGD